MFRRSCGNSKPNKLYIITRLPCRMLSSNNSAISFWLVIVISCLVIGFYSKSIDHFADHMIDMSPRNIYSGD